MYNHKKIHMNHNDTECKGSAYNTSHGLADINIKINVMVIFQVE
jgi:hypothetical protein